jgi:hypothetical protein
MDGGELRSPGTLALRRDLAKASGRMDLADEIERQLRALRGEE